jgi:hypothetical protein
MPQFRADYDVEGSLVLPTGSAPVLVRSESPAFEITFCNADPDESGHVPKQGVDFSLHPIGRAAGAVGRALALGHDAFEPELAGVAENNFAIVVLKVLVQPQPRTSLGEHGGKRSLAHLKRLAAP